jgi:hypothetical protein
MRKTLVCSLLALSACAGSPITRLESVQPLAGEVRFASLRQLTYGGTNAEAYWSFDGGRLVFQHKGKWLRGAPEGESASGPECDQIYSIRTDGSGLMPISRGAGRTTCGFFSPEDDRVLFSTTVSAGRQCPPNPDFSKGYVWPIYESYQIHAARPDGSDPIPAEPGAPRAYTAETTVCQDGSVVFTSDRDGDLELYVGKLGSMGTIGSIRRVTRMTGYDGGAFFSPDCKRIVWRASRPRPGKETEEYQELLEKNLVRPGELELWIADADGTHARELTHLKAASFSPSFTPDGKRILFSSNRNNPGSREFDLFLIDTDGTRLEQVTRSGTFDSFPMFSPDGRWLAFSSNRRGSEPRETNVFIAEWKETPREGLSLDSPLPADRFKALVERLSAPEMEGRAAGTKGGELAEKLVAERMRALGLKALSDAFPGAKGVEGYFQEAPVRTKTESLRASNVVGAWGERCGRVVPVVVGAHLDHLGTGGSESLEPTQKGLHAGADDNASGVAAVLEAARSVIAAPASAKGCYLFAAFAGEEAGIVGSSRLAELLVSLRQKPKAMLNLDMVGRMEGNKLIVFGSDSAVEWKAMVERTCSEIRLSCPGGGDGYGPSDHMAFYLKGVPVLHFFTGPHVDYHRASDTAEKINATGGIQVAEAVASIALRAGNPGQRLRYKKASPNAVMGRLIGKKDGKREGSSAYLGTIPDYSTLTSPSGPGGGGEPAGGVKLAGTRPGSPADQAGVRAGDVIFGIGTKGIRTLEEFTEVLRELKPGEKVELRVRRGEKTLSLHATVGSRTAAPEGQAHP